MRENIALEAPIRVCLVLMVPTLLPELHRAARAQEESTTTQWPVLALTALPRLTPPLVLLARLDVWRALALANTHRLGQPFV
jgi:hypothetical protein